LSLDSRCYGLTVRHWVAVSGKVFAGERAAPARVGLREGG